MSDPIRIFVGTEEKTEIARKVLEHSIVTRTKAEVEFTPMIGPEWEYPLDGIKVGTGFSLRRWMIPAYCGWQGRAIYLDADQLVFGDIKELYTSWMPAGPVVSCSFQPDKYYPNPAPQTSVMVIDCAAAKDWWGFHIDKVLAHLREKSDRETYARLMHAHWLLNMPKGPVDWRKAFDGVAATLNRISKFPVEWNHLNVYKEGKTKLLHYTKEDTQVWYRPDHPLTYLWEAELVSAIKAGRILKEEFELALAQWGVKQDWRNMNGLNPYYRKLLPLFS